MSAGGLAGSAGGPDRLVVAGPILRRCEPDRVLIWLATAGDAEVSGEVVAIDGHDRGEVLARGPARSIRVGQHLRIHLVECRPVDDPLPRGELLGYDIEVTEPARAPQGLAELGLLAGPRAITYVGLPLPTFVLQPEAAPLRLFHGSCRLLHGAGDDAYDAADGELASRAWDPARRPAALLLTGDQIYGDEVGGPLARHLSELGRDLVDPDDAHSLPGVSDLADHGLYGRQDLCESIGYTSGKAGNHILTRGEFAASYLVAWDEANWPARFPSAVEALPAGSHPPRELRKLRRQWDTEAANLERARAGVPAARRVMANVATYTIFDDHDVTDDWNLSQEWTDTVRANPAGRRAVANALDAYWSFQGWANAPESFDDSFVATVGGEDRDAADDLLWNFDRWLYATPTRPPVLMLDTRTQRAFDSPQGGPRLMSEAELGRVRDLAREVGVGWGGPAVLVSAVPVFGLEIQERRQRYLVGKTGPYEIDFEAWHANLHGLVDLMHVIVDDLDLAECVVLSGDVHYGINVEANFRIDDKRLRVAQLVSSSFKHAGGFARLGLHTLGAVVRADHARIGWDGAPNVDRLAAKGLLDRLVSRAVNTDSWSEDAPVFLSPRLGARLSEEEPRYSESRRYLRPIDRRKSVLVGENNVGVVTITADSVEHRILGRVDGRTRTHTVRFPLGVSHRH